MFLFNSNHGNDPISFPDHPFFHFPSPNFDDQDLLLQQPQYSILLHHQHHYHQQQQQHQPLDETPATFLNLNMVDSEYSDMINNNVSGIHDNSTGREQQIQRKMSSSKTKRDRHSKINTLRGPRDRRMRLSLPVAREFFGLQDMLGVDKASKTVEWLILQAKHAISKLSREQSCHDGSGDGEGGSAAARSTSSISDSEVVLGKLPSILLLESVERRRGQGREQEHRRSSSCKSLKTQIETGEESAGTHIEDQRMFDDQDHDSLMIMGRWSPSNSINQSLRCGVFAELAKLFIIDDYDLPHIRIWIFYKASEAITASWPEESPRAITNLQFGIWERSRAMWKRKGTKAQGRSINNQKLS